MKPKTISQLMKPKTISQHESKFIHVPKDYVQVLGLLLLYAVGTFLQWNILQIAIENKAVLDGVSWFALLTNLGFALAFNGIACFNIIATIRLSDNKSGLLSLLLLLLLLPLMLPLLPLPPPLLLPPLLLVLPLLLLLLPLMPNVK